MTAPRSISGGAKRLRSIQRHRNVRYPPNNSLTWPDFGAHVCSKCGRRPSQRSLIIWAIGIRTRHYSVFVVEHINSVERHGVTPRWADQLRVRKCHEALKVPRQEPSETTYLIARRRSSET